MDAVIRVTVSTIRVSKILCDVFLYGWTTVIKAAMPMSMKFIVHRQKVKE